PSKRDRGAQREDRSVTDPPGRRIRVRNAAGGIEHILEIRLDLAPAVELETIAQLKHFFTRPDRMKLTGETRDIGIERLRGVANLRVSERDPDLVIGAAKRPFIEEPDIGIDIDQVAVAGCDACPGEHA